MVAECPEKRVEKDQAKTADVTLYTKTNIPTFYSEDDGEREVFVAESFGVLGEAAKTLGGERPSFLLILCAHKRWGVWK